MYIFFKTFSGHGLSEASMQPNSLYVVLYLYIYIYENSSMTELLFKLFCVKVNPLEGESV